ncbi:MAG: hypothetical protein ACRD97_04700 [Nitrososphaeraceae archaeon]
MKVRVYFCKEPDIQSIILRNNNISRQALDTVLVSESEFKNIVNVGKTWIKFIGTRVKFNSQMSDLEYC